MDQVSRPYQDELLKALANPVEAAAYLNAALDEGSTELFVVALQNVAKAQTLKKIMTSSPEQDDIQLDPEHLELVHISKILERVGLKFTADLKKDMKKRKTTPGAKIAKPKRRKLIKGDANELVELKVWE